MPIPTAEERIGTVLGGRYRLESILGTGGTSVVYTAQHSFTGRSVALKILKHEHGKDRGLVSRFLREARVVSTLIHPNVVAILDMGTEDGDTYLAMERVVGDSLSTLLAREGRLSLERTLELLRPVMDAVETAHGRGIIHRDLKPDNIIVGDRGDGRTRAILLDFGMAKTNEAAWGHVTQSGVLVGTPLYMSPEQAEGASDVGAAADVWSMGVTLYRCLSGELPFVATNPTALLLAITRGQHVPLGERIPSLPKPIAAWVEGALFVDRARRYPDMRAMLAALDGALAGEAPVVPPAPANEGPRSAPPERAARSARATGSIPEAPAVTQATRPRAQSLAIGVAVVALVAVAIFFALRSAPAAAPVSEALAPVAAEPIAPIAPPPLSVRTTPAADLARAEPPSPVLEQPAARRPDPPSRHLTHAAVPRETPVTPEVVPPPVVPPVMEARSEPPAHASTGLATEW